MTNATLELLFQQWMAAGVPGAHGVTVPSPVEKAAGAAADSVTAHHLRMAVKDVAGSQWKLGLVRMTPAVSLD